MARSAKQATGRTRITSQSHDAITDDGNALFSLVNGEQLHIEVSLSWFTSLNGCTITPKVIEGDNSDLGTKPTVAATSPTITTLDIIDADINDNKFKIVFPQDLISSWTASPLPNKPVYGFFGLEIADNNTGNAQQIWKPVRGMVEVLYSPTEVV